MILKFDHVPNPTWDIPSWIWDIILFGTLIIPNLIFRFGMSKIGIPVWDNPSWIWDIGRVWVTTEPHSSYSFFSSSPKSVLVLFHTYLLLPEYYVHFLDKTQPLIFH